MKVFLAVIALLCGFNALASSPGSFRIQGEAQSEVRECDLVPTPTREEIEKMKISAMQDAEDSALSHCKKCEVSQEPGNITSRDCQSKVQRLSDYSIQSGKTGVAPYVCAHYVDASADFECL